MVHLPLGVLIRKKFPPLFAPISFTERRSFLDDQAVCGDMFRIKIRDPRERLLP